MCYSIMVISTSRYCTSKNTKSEYAVIRGDIVLWKLILWTKCFREGGGKREKKGKQNHDFGNDNDNFTTTAQCLWSRIYS